MKLSKTEWETLDGLLAKSGFGGYYDLVECLYAITEKMHPRGNILVEKMREDKPDLHKIVSVMMLIKGKS